MKHGLVLVLPLALLAACGGETSRTLGLTRDAPDEFQVTTRAPLSMPPTLGDLPRPRPGAARPQEVPAALQAQSALVPGAGLGGSASRATPGSGEVALLGSAGGPVTGDIRSRVDEESLRLERTDRNLVDRLMFWREQEPPGVPVDPSREAQRLRENAALGRDAVEGETPVIQPQRRRGLFNWNLF
ncbi:DUF3035 domain-containing protein [Sabulicella glaciei]|uniref:DUF3035 domain-containing protein n=1 Tax=Sabulicella glaciei TaxID=2984948 RepID=A0ABT3NUF0_9PROT|nr:DUF3035 domain-containing protein [Roseococcus sp. MDT2-1-1]MCW8085786.1 DUF3035 domain-containing protein [Roseococcus sp. MDT2-1-1]